MVTKKLLAGIGVALLALQLTACDDRPVGEKANQAPVSAAVQGTRPTPRTDLARAPVSGSAKCNLELLQGKSLQGSRPEIARMQAAGIVGWYADIAGQSVGTGVELVIHDTSFVKQWSVPLDARRPRQDVMEAWDYPAGMLDTGFAIALDLSGLPPGQYGMYVHDAGGETSVCGIGFGFALQ